MAAQVDPAAASFRFGYSSSLDAPFERRPYARRTEGRKDR